MMSKSYLQYHQILLKSISQVSSVYVNCSYYIKREKLWWEFNIGT